jgi:ABC-2 type transport system ATP-binding protein
MAPEPERQPVSTDGSAAVRLEGLTKQLRNGILAVDHLDLEVARGSVLALIGPNGSGKTITLRMILGLVRPTSGRAVLFGEEVRPGADVLGRVGALVDGPGFVPHLSGRRNLDLAVRLIRLSGGTADLDAAIDMAGLGEAVDRSYSSYSHGMRYRLAMAQAMLGSPHLLLLDEPTTGMDPAQVQQVHRAISSCAEAGVTVILSSHSMSEIEQVCTQAAILQSGRLLLAGSIADLVGRAPTLILEVDDPDPVALALRDLAGSPQISMVGPRSFAIAGGEFRPAEVVDRLDRAKVQVVGMRPGGLEDSYLALLEGNSSGSPEDTAHW